MHLSVCLTILQTLEGTQPLFVVNSVKLHVTAYNIELRYWRSHCTGRVERRKNFKASDKTVERKINLVKVISIWFMFVLF